MKYNFDEVVNRENTNSVKYDLRKELFGKPDIIPMWVADMDFKTPDFIVNAIKKRAEHEVFGYSFRSESYFNSIINWVNKKHNWEIKKDWISFSPGIVPAINMAVMAFSEPGDKIIVQPPVYFPFFSAVKDNDRVLVENPLILKDGRYHMDFEDLESKLSDAKILILSNPHNPGGSVWTKYELNKLGELCVKYKVLIFSDEIHSDLVFKDYQYTPLASISEAIAENTITFIAPSKTFNMAALATSSVIASNVKLKEAYEKVLDTIHIGMGNVFGAEASEAAYTKGKEWLNELIDYLQSNLDYIVDYFENNIPEIKVIKPEGTYMAWLDCSALKLDKDLKDFMIEDAKLGFNDGRMFGTGGESFMRLNFACPKTTLEKALGNLKEAISK